jgi:hypothetical protein
VCNETPPWLEAHLAGMSEHGWPVRLNVSDWVKCKNPACAAVKREVEED